MTREEEKKLVLRAKHAHERKHGQSTWIEARAVGPGMIRIKDHERGIVTYWAIKLYGPRRITLYRQYGGER